jgi:hypothetical protein
MISIHPTRTDRQWCRELLQPPLLGILLLRVLQSWLLFWYHLGGQRISRGGDWCPRSPWRRRGEVCDGAARVGHERRLEIKQDHHLDEEDDSDDGVGTAHGC